MDNFREMSYVRALLVALVVLFVCGTGMPGGAFAKVEIQNGHEGDPLDGSDVVGGSGGGDAGDVGDTKTPLTHDCMWFCNVIEMSSKTANEYLIVPLFFESEFVWIVLVNEFKGELR